MKELTIIQLKASKQLSTKGSLYREDSSKPVDSNKLEEKLWLIAKTYIHAFVAISIDDRLIIEEKHYEDEDIEKSDKLCLESNIESWSNELFAAYMLYKLTGEANFFSKNCRVENATVLFGFRDKLIKLLRPPEARIPYYLIKDRDKAKKRAIARGYARAIMSLRNLKPTVKSDKKKVSTSKKRRLRRKFYKLLKTKDWGHKVKLPITRMEVALFMEKCKGNQENIYINRRITSKLMLEALLSKMKYPNVLLFVKEYNSLDKLRQAKGYVVVDCNNLIDHPMASHIGNYFLLIKRGFNITNEKDSINPCWAY